VSQKADPRNVLRQIDKRAGTHRARDMRERAPARLRGQVRHHAYLTGALGSFVAFSRPAVGSFIFVGHTLHDREVS
jgi:hypothetical protein